MKFVRPALAVALAASALLSVNVADAAAKPCKLMTDAAGDAPITNTRDALFPINEPPAPVVQAPPGWPTANVGPSTDALDITSADIASDKKWVTAVIRVKKLAATAPAAAPSGIQWELSFTANGATITLTAVTDPTGAVRYQGSYKGLAGGSLYAGGIIGAFDLKKSEVRISAPVSLLDAQVRVKPGLKFTNLTAEAGPILTGPEPSKKVAKGGVLFTLNFAAADSASTKKTYSGSSVNCVVPGK